MRAHFCPDDAGTPAMPKDGEDGRGSPAMCREKNEDSAEAGRSCDALVAALAPRVRGRTHWHTGLPPSAPSSCPCSIALFHWAIVPYEASRRRQLSRVRSLSRRAAITVRGDRGSDGEARAGRRMDVWTRTGWAGPLVDFHRRGQSVYSAPHHGVGSTRALTAWLDISIKSVMTLCNPSMSFSLTFLPSQTRRPGWRATRRVGSETGGI
jgi:hypothetical protein